MAHTCHAEQCNVPVPPKMMMCRRHWFMVPKPLRDAVWAEYRLGQEIDKQPSAEYLQVAQAAIQAVADRETRARNYTAPPKCCGGPFCGLSIGDQPLAPCERDAERRASA